MNYCKYWRDIYPDVVKGWVERLSLTAYITLDKIAAFLYGDLDFGQDLTDGTDLPQVPFADFTLLVDIINPFF